MKGKYDLKWLSPLRSAMASCAPCSAHAYTYSRRVKRNGQKIGLQVHAVTTQKQEKEAASPSPSPVAVEGSDSASGGRSNATVNDRAWPPWKGVSRALMAGVFVAGIGAGVAFDSVVSLEPSNVASREVVDRNSPSTQVCAMNGASAMVFDQRVFLSFNPFNVYVSQPEVKPGCVLRRSNWSVLERRNLVSKSEVDSCKRGMNTFAFVGDLDGDPKVTCVYHSEQAENQFMQGESDFATTPKRFE